MSSDKSQSCLVMLDVAGRIADSEETIFRHNSYAKELDLKSNGSIKLIVVTPRNKISTEFASSDLQFEWIRIGGNRKNLPGFILLSFLALKKQNVVAFICGDPWEPYWVSRILKLTGFRKAKIQVQLHGDFASDSWGHGSPILSIRKLLISLRSKSIDSIRFTSKAQQKNLQSKFKIRCEDQRVIPVPLNIPQGNLGKIQNQELVIGLVGRIHTERGLDKFIELAHKAFQLNPSTQFHIIGSGEEKIWLQDQLEEFIPNSNIIFFGQLSGTKYFEALSNLDILCSLASSESYGRVAREALALGVSIIATHSAGLDELSESLPRGVIHFLPDVLEIEELEGILQVAVEAQTPPDLLQFFLDKNRSNISDLIQSWLEMVQSD